MWRVKWIGAMSDTIEGSSKAAHCAQAVDQPKYKKFFQRFFKKKNETNIDSLAQSDMASSVFIGISNLSKMRVEDVVIPRADIVAVSYDIDLEGLLKVFRSSGFSRLPVYEETLDVPLGMIHLKDVALRHGFNIKPSKFSVKKLKRELLFVPPSMPIGVLLQKMQTDRLHMALVIDEYGGVDGLVTIEDLLEQVVGEIADEHDMQEDSFWVKENDDVYLVQARISLDEFEKLLRTRFLDDDTDDEIDTLGGLLLMMTGRVPTRGEVISHPSGYEFEIVEADPRSIKKLRVYKKSMPSQG